MKRKSATINRVAAHRVEPFCRPELMAPRIAAVLMPPSPDMNSSFGSEPCISRRTSWRKDITSSVYTFTMCRRRPSKIRPPPKEKSLLLIPARPFGTTGLAGQKQDRQHYKRSGDEGQNKSAEKAHSAVNTAYSREGAEHYVDEGFEHGARSRRSTALRLRWMHLLQSPNPRGRGYGPVAAPASGDLEARFFRESHMSRWALMNCR